eukprot:GHRR01023950.1.p1 GENE.GHRR01023950.1~~GHRR01023950.1.p1  ORF type:complete len:106 (-),score=17.59 GHRR01023950.1:998-1315(-)
MTPALPDMHTAAMLQGGGQLHWCTNALLPTLPFAPLRMTSLSTASRRPCSTDKDRGIAAVRLTQQGTSSREASKRENWSVTTDTWQCAWHGLSRTVPSRPAAVSE